MNRDVLLSALCAGGLCAAVMSTLGFTGPLDPPEGPVSPTGPTLSEIEARTPVTRETAPGNETATFLIDEPGSYYLVGDVHAEPGKSGIFIEASRVTLDLNGFTVHGAEGPFGVLGASHLATVRNGSVRGVGEGTGVAAGGTGVTLEDLRVSNNETGIHAFRDATIRNCVVVHNKGHGVVALNGSRVVNCVVTHNQDGVLAAMGSIVEGCTVSRNHGVGIELASFGGNVARNNICQGNVEVGIRTSSFGVEEITDNLVVGGKVGIESHVGRHFVARNRVNVSPDHTAFEIFGGGAIGPIVVENGFIETTNPWANFDLSPPPHEPPIF